MASIQWNWGRAAFAFSLNSSVQGRLHLIISGLQKEVQNLANELQSVNPTGAASLQAIAQKLNEEMSLGSVAVNILFPTFLGAIPGRWGLFLGLSLTAIRIYNLNHHILAAVSQVTAGASFSNDRLYLSARSPITWLNAWKTGILVFFDVLEPDEDIATLTQVVRAVKAFDFATARMRAQQFGLSMSRYSFDYVEVEAGTKSRTAKFSFRYYPR